MYITNINKSYNHTSDESVTQEIETNVIFEDCIILKMFVIDLKLWRRELLLIDSVKHYIHEPIRVL